MYFVEDPAKMKCLQECHLARGSKTWCNHFGKECERITRINMPLAYVPAHPCLGIYTGEMETYTAPKTCTKHHSNFGPNSENHKMSPISTSRLMHKYTVQCT
jgi:hypothetical protein